MDSQKIYIPASLSFKSLSSEMASEKEKKTVLEAYVHLPLCQPIETLLSEFENILNPLIHQVNVRIQSSENQSIKIKKNGEWTLDYGTRLNDFDNPFYNQFPHLPLIDILRFVHEQTGFLNKFTHIKPYYSKSRMEENSILGCIMSYATFIGISKMSQLSDITYSALESASRNFMTLENLQEANDLISDAFMELSLYPYWNLMDNRLIASLDGKKRTTKMKHIMARYSSKYFGRKRGIVSYSMLCNYFCLDSKIIGANEHESHHLPGMVMNNSSSIQPDFYTGDSHSTNAINPALMHLMNDNFVPYLKNIAQKAQNICCFGSKKAFEEGLIIPTHSIMENRIKNEWSNCQHIVASLLSKNSNHHILVKKLSQHSKTHPTLAALIEYGQIPMSIHILRFIDDPEFRQALRIALNRGEGFHQLTGALSKIGGNEFKGRTELDLQIWEACIRLVANCIIFYNAFILSKIYETLEARRETASLDMIKRLSPIAWRHIHLGGKYDFSTTTIPLNLEEMIQNLDFDIKF